jgi:phage baseplate assembly protein W
MAVGISPKLPLDKGFDVNKTIASKIRQNLKMVLLTSPGERVALPSFGVGLRRFLFEPLTNATLGRIDSKIRQQVRVYVPDAKIENIMFDSALNNSDMLSKNDQQVIISIDYRIPTIARSIRLSLKATEQDIIVQ